MQNTILRQLNEMTELQNQADALALDKLKALHAATPKEVRDMRFDIDAEFADKQETVKKKIAALKKQIVIDVKSHKGSVKGESLHAIYGLRTSWDNKALIGYAADKPELQQFKKETPTVTIRKSAKPDA